VINPDDCIEPGILPVCDALNAIPGVCTKYSCEGHTVILKRPYVMFTAPEGIALKLHRSLGIGRGIDKTLKYNWCITAHFQDDGSTSYCLQPNDYRLLGKSWWPFPKWWRRSMDSELIGLASVLQAGCAVA
jgi:hypothetical protein